MREVVIVSKDEIYKMVKICANHHEKVDEEDCDNGVCPLFGYCLNYYTGDDECIKE